MFATERLTLREFRDSDMADFLKQSNDFEVQQLTSIGYITPQSSAYENTVRTWVNGSLLFTVITLKETDTFVGFISLSQRSPKNRDGSLAVTIIKEHWNKGYGTEALRFIVDYAFKSLALHRVSLGVFSSNPRAASVYKKLGFVEEGREREAFWLDGKWEDIILMSMLEHEWKEHLNGKTK